MLFAILTSRFNLSCRATESTPNCILKLRNYYIQKHLKLNQSKQYRIMNISMELRAMGSNDIKK